MHAHRRRGGDSRKPTYSINHAAASSSALSSTPAWAKTENTSTNPELQNRFVRPEDMSKDRTNEFLAICRSMGTNAMAGKGAGRNRQRSQIAARCRAVGKDITNTWDKLGRLTQLCKSTTLFNDKPVEIQELTYIIKQDMDQMRQSLGELDRMQNGTANTKDGERHNKSMVRSLQTKLAAMSNNFKSTLEARRENMKAQSDRRSQFSGAGIPGDSQSSFMRSTVLFNDDQRAQNNDSSLIPLNQQFQGQMYEEQDQYLQDRSKAMEQVESTIVELGDMFVQLAGMVKAQEETIMRIDSNVEESEMNIESAHTELLKYFRSVTSNRWLMVKVFATMIIFFIVFVVFFA